MSNQNLQFNAEIFRAAMGGQLHPASSSKYLVEFPVSPNIMKGAKAILSPNEPNPDTSIVVLSLAATAAELPMRQLDTIERRYSGPVRQVPVGHTYSTMNIEFIEDHLRRVRGYFSRWQENVFAEDNSFTVPFYDNIVIPQMRIRLFGQDGAEMDSYVIYEVFPINIGSTQLSWSAKDQIMTTNIEFSFHRWERVPFDTKNAEAPSPKYDRSEKNEPQAEPGRSRYAARDRLKKKTRFQDFVDRVRDVNNTIRFAKGSFKTAKDLARQARDLKNLKVNNFEDFTRAAGTVGGVVRTTTDSINSFGSGVQKIEKKFSTDTINKFFNS